MTFDRRNSRTGGWLYAGSLTGHARRIDDNHPKANNSENLNWSESSQSDDDSVLGANSGSKFLTLYDVY